MLCCVVRNEVAAKLCSDHIGHGAATRVISSSCRTEADQVAQPPQASGSAKDSVTIITKARVLRVVERRFNVEFKPGQLPPRLAGCTVSDRAGGRDREPAQAEDGIGTDIVGQPYQISCQFPAPDVQPPSHERGLLHKDYPARRQKSASRVSRREAFHFTFIDLSTGPIQTASCVEQKMTAIG